MNHCDFKAHFINALLALHVSHYENKIFTVVPVEEKKARPNARDDMMRLCFLPRTRELTFDETVKLFTWSEGYYPCWIKIALNGESVLLETSLRMRKAGAKDDRRFYPFQFDK